jgi:hypothetical protein
MREREADLTVLARSGRWQARPRPAVRTDLARSHLGLPGLAATAAPPEIQRTIPERCLNRLKQRRDPPPDTRSGLSFGVDPACGDGITVFLEGKFARIDVHRAATQRLVVDLPPFRHSVTSRARHPSGIGVSSLSLRSVAQLPPCQGDQHNRQRTKAAEDRQQAVVAQDGSGKERSQDPSNRGIKARVQQDGDEHRNHRDTDEGEQVPPKAHPPQHEPTQKAANSLPSVAPVMTNAAKNGPIKILTGAVHCSTGLLYGRSPAPYSESTYGSSKSHVPAKASTKKETNGWRASRALMPPWGAAGCTGAAVAMARVLSVVRGSSAPPCCMTPLP